jgi:putative membrane protein
MLAHTISLTTAVAACAFLLTSSSERHALTAGPGPLASSAHFASTQALDDATIVAIFDAANTADIETGKLAAARGHSSEVRAFGAMLAHDHEQVRQMGRDLARKLGVTPTPPADDAGLRAHKAAMTKLRAASDAEFDHAFLQHEEAFHASVINAVTTTLLPAIKNAELKALVTKVAPAFEAHRRAAEDLDKQIASRGDR